MHSTNGGSTFLQSVDMRYNIRGWLKSINNRHLDVADNNDDTNDLFGMEFNYDASDAGLNSVAQYNGNISDIRWKTRPTMIENAYGYQYDKLNQLISARYATWGSGSWSTDNKYSTNSITYDLNGNILSMSQNWNGALADNLTYVNYGNRLVGVDDAITDSPVTNDFEDHSASALPDPNNPASWEYLYDGNGNMTTDANKGITVAYNFLNLPTKVDFGSGDSIVWVYTVSGATNDFEDHAALALPDPRHVWCLPGLGKNAEQAPEFALIFGGKRGTAVQARECKNQGTAFRRP